MFEFFSRLSRHPIATLLCVGLAAGLVFWTRQIPERLQAGGSSAQVAFWELLAINAVFLAATIGVCIVLSTHSTALERRAADFERRLSAAADARQEALITELEAKNAELEQFTYSVSHDLKSPLITVRGFLGMLERDLEDGDRERVDFDLGRIRRATDHMRQLLEDLLQLSRADRTGAPEAVPLARLATEAVELVAGRLVERGVDVEVASELPTVLGDRTRLRVVFQNLLDNAAKFTSTTERPTIRVGVRRSPDHDDPDGVIFVADNGTGLDTEDLERIFTVFEQVDGAEGGTGLGLAIVKRIVEAHGGRIWAESEGLGCGTTFCLTLPQRPESVV